MKWQRAIKTSLFLILALLLAAVCYARYIATTRTLDVKGNIEGTIQFGYYDIGANKKERYDFNTSIINGELVTTITGLLDNPFTIQGAFIMEQNNGPYKVFRFAPVNFSGNKQGLMIDGLVDLLIHKKIQMWNLDINGQRLFVWQTGGIFLPPQ